MIVFLSEVFLEDFVLFLFWKLKTVFLKIIMSKSNEEV